MSVPAIRPSFSTTVKRNSETRGSRSRTTDRTRRPVRCRQPRVTISPFSASMATMTRSRPMVRQSFSRNVKSTESSWNARVPTITLTAPRDMASRAASMVRMPPPTRQGAMRQISRIRFRLSPFSMAASRSMTEISPKREKDSAKARGSSRSRTLARPETSWTALPSLRSIEG